MHTITTEAEEKRYAELQEMAIDFARRGETGNLSAMIEHGLPVNLGEIVTLLLQHGADIDADNGGGMTPLMFAATFGRTRVVTQLQARGASLKRRNWLGVSASFLVRISQWPARLLQRFGPHSKPLPGAQKI
jgi:hypothetical protein